jgi:hypothetical protein
LALAGCGGSDDEGASGTTVEPSTETGATDDRRLSAASWATYLEARDRARAVNAKATAAFRECRDVVIDAADTDAVKSCLGDSTTAVVTEGEEALATLSSFEDEVGGACAAELTDLQGYLRLYTASVQSLGTAVDEGDVASVQSSIDEAADALARERETSAPFEAACKPA